MTEPGGRAIGAALAAAVAHLPDFLPKQRWFGGKGRAIARVEIRDQAALPEHPGTVLAMIDVIGPANECATYFLPFVAAEAAPVGHSAEPMVCHGGLAVHDGLVDPSACRAILRGIVNGRTVATERGGSFAFRGAAGRSGETRSPLDSREVDRIGVKRLNVEQSNSSVIFGDALILKAFRRTQEGLNPEVEILRFLGEQTTFDHVPRLLGWAEYEAPSGTSMPVGVLESFVPNDGDGWDWVLRTVRSSRFQASGSTLPNLEPGTWNLELFPALGALGRTLAELHLALASRPDLPDMAPEPITAHDAQEWRARTHASLDDALRQVEYGLTAWAPDLRPGVQVVRDGASVLRATIDRFGLLAEGTIVKTRHHGDFHLGQTLVGPDGWTIIDFEGEPLRSLAERRAKQTPLRDVAGLLRSLDYAEVTLAREGAATTGGSASGDRDLAIAALFADARRAFLAAYVGTVRAAGAPLLPSNDDDLASVLRALEVEKALYELSYEAGNRPDWVAIPLSALARLATAG